MRRLRKVFMTAGLTVLIGSTAAAVGTTVAQAASYTYADLSAPENSVYFSGTRASISGGYAGTEPFSADGGQVVAYLETYFPAPGYQTVSYNTGTGGQVNVSHINVSNANQKCWWGWPYADGSIGSLDFTCRTYG